MCAGVVRAMTGLSCCCRWLSSGHAGSSMNHCYTKTNFSPLIQPSPGDTTPHPPPPRRRLTRKETHITCFPVEALTLTSPEFRAVSTQLLIMITCLGYLKITQLRVTQCSLTTTSCLNTNHSLEMACPLHNTDLFLVRSVRKSSNGRIICVTTSACTLVNDRTFVRTAQSLSCSAATGTYTAQNVLPTLTGFHEIIWRQN